MKTKTIKQRCNSCEVMYINGIRCHEHGCPEAYKEELRECKWCGCEFEPEDRYQKFCSEECAECYNN
jgi:hypothetical protein